MQKWKTLTYASAFHAKGEFDVSVPVGINWRPREKPIGNHSLTLISHTGIPTNQHRPLYVAIRANRKAVIRTLVDNGSSNNIIPISLLDSIGISRTIICTERALMIHGVGNVIQAAVGSVMIRITCAGLDDMHEFKVIKAAPSYHILLGRPWIHRYRGVGFSYHLCCVINTQWTV